MSLNYGMMCYWRPKGSVAWHFGYTSAVGSSGLVRMGRWNGDTMGGTVVSVDEIEWKEYRS
jgi:hypothetical protein